MTTDREPEMLASELHDLVDGITPDRRAGMHRTQRAIARRARNRRIAVGAGGAAAALVAATVFVAVDRDTPNSQRPAGTTTQPSVFTPVTPLAPTTTTSTTVPTTVPGSPIESVFPLATGREAPLYAKSFRWGTRDDEVAFQTPQGEGASGGPLAFTASRDGNIQLLDHSSSRIVRFEDGSAAADRIALASPAVTAAAFDAKGRIIVATVGDLAVFGSDGALIENFPEMSLYAITALEVDGRFVYSVAENRTRTLVLRDEGDGYFDTRDSEPEPPAISVDLNTETHVLTMTVPSGREYRIHAAVRVSGVSAVRFLPDGRLAFVLRLEQPRNQGPDTPLNFMLGFTDAADRIRYASVTASQGHLLQGPAFAIDDGGIAEMSSTTTDGVTVSYHSFDCHGCGRT